MIYRLIGKNDPSYIWKIINAGTSRKDLIKSYSIKNINNQQEQHILVNYFPYKNALCIESPWYQPFYSQEKLSRSVMCPWNSMQLRTSLLDS